MNKIINTIVCAAICAGSLSSMPVFAHEYGLQLYSLRHQMEEDMPLAFSQISDWGLHAVEGGSMLNGMPLDEYKAELAKNQLKIVSVDTNYAELRDNPIAAVYKAKYFSADYATFYWIPHGENRPFSIEDAKEAVAVLNSAGKLLEENGITLQYHAHGYEFLPYQDGTVFDYMVQHTKHAKFQMDVYWIKHAGVEPVELLQKYPGIFTSLHLKDREKGTPNSSTGHADVETNVVLGAGDVGIASAVKEAKLQGIHYMFLEDESSRVMEQIPQSIDYLKALEAENKGVSN
ncbi:TIM barrel protein [Gilvimarinus sp. SDUM040013]|uniref:TIM barrel protein n=1 Tax=Gilvimarinus gilvus TaxID=3058038 RepID=A0ABU4RUQ4_9GAMM|nr:TIM barrel protein [Gilvimarinus sp. SDUM040013]MDO3388520.1 TIM barrel protein [Gilvimarinus sp. SDUM040013]MDX6848608.1 TIM barrel protein [Gilvimarinus sp. SDUM040013]